LATNAAYTNSNLRIFKVKLFIFYSFQQLPLTTFNNPNCPAHIKGRELHSILSGKPRPFNTSLKLDDLGLPAVDNILYMLSRPRLPREAKPLMPSSCASESISSRHYDNSRITIVSASLRYSANFQSNVQGHPLDIINYLP
jgi:hypothetical protein